MQHSAHLNENKAVYNQKIVFLLLKSAQTDVSD